MIRMCKDDWHVGPSSCNAISSILFIRKGSLIEQRMLCHACTIECKLSFESNDNAGYVIGGETFSSGGPCVMWQLHARGEGSAFSRTLSISDRDQAGVDKWTTYQTKVPTVMLPTLDLHQEYIRVMFDTWGMQD